jgi:hypothetical protein
MDTEESILGMSFDSDGPMNFFQLITGKKTAEDSADSFNKKVINEIKQSKYS